jgi:hypothetical protein
MEEGGGGHLKILGARRVTKRRFNLDPIVLGATG